MINWQAADSDERIGLRPRHFFKRLKDNLDRLVNEPGQTLGYDGNSNRLWDSVGSYSYEAASNRMVTAPLGTVVLDAAGNTVQLGEGRLFTYNDAGRMTAATVNGQTSNYQYYSEQLRARKSAQGLITQYHYGPDGRLLAETNYSTGAVIREYIWDDTTPLAQANYNAPIIYLHTDALGTPRLGTWSNGTEVWRWDSDAFGTTAPTRSAVVNLRFPGQYFDAETGLHYNWHRTYDPASGRYVESDPIGLAGGLNTFGYVGGNPNGFSDPLGLRPAPCADSSPGCEDGLGNQNVKPRCVTAECAAGLPPTKQDNRTLTEIDISQCKFVCGALWPGPIIPLAKSDLLPFVGGLVSSYAGCKWICEDPDRRKSFCVQ